MGRRRTIHVTLAALLCVAPATSSSAQQRYIATQAQIAEWNQHDDYRETYKDRATDLKSGDTPIKYPDLPSNNVRFAPKTGPVYRYYPVQPYPANSRAFTAKDYFTSTTGTIFNDGFNLAGGGWHCVPTSGAVVLNWARQTVMKDLPNRTRRQLIDTLAEDSDTNDQSASKNNGDDQGHMGTARQDFYTAFGNYIQSVPKYAKYDGPKLVEFRYSREAYKKKIESNLPVIMLYKNPDSGNGHAVVGYGYWIDPDIDFDVAVVMDPFFGRKDQPQKFNLITDIDNSGGGTLTYGAVSSAPRITSSVTGTTPRIATPTSIRVAQASPTPDEIANSAPGALAGAWEDVKASFIAIPDYGDAPSSYDPIPTPAAHQITVAEWLGPRVSSEVDKFDAVDDADGVANTNNHDAYDDGVVFSMNPGGMSTAQVTVFTQIYEGGQRFDASDSSKQLYLAGWADFNHDMQWTPDEQIAGQFIGGPGIGLWDASQESQQFLLSFLTPLNMDDTWFRFRLAYGEAVGPTGLTMFGEVEDYLVPEPASLSLLLLGWVMVRRRGRNAQDLP